jgi:Fe-S oxidoreductase
VEYALSNCLACRACTSECPSNVNLPLLKAELLYAKTKRNGLTSRQRLISSVDLLGRIGTTMPWLMNSLFNSRSIRHVFGKIFGITGERPTPAFSRKRFDRWFAKHHSTNHPRRGSVILWDDTFVRYHEPHIGIAAVAVLEAAGFAVGLPKQRKCCGRPAFSVGNLDAAEKLGQHNLAMLVAEGGNAPIIFLEPSCYSMFAEDYRELKLADAEAIAARCFLFEDFIGQLLDREPRALKFKPKTENVVIHAHCHAKSLLNAGLMQRLAARLPGRKATLLDTGCCGMAGSFGMLESKYELSLKIAEPLITQLNHQPFGTTAVVSGTSCRHQVEHLATIRTKHMAEVIADALA